MCDYLATDVCGDHGSCVGDMSTGNICDCDGGWGGLWCEVNDQDSLTPCQLRERLMTWLDAQVKAVDKDAKLQVDMKVDHVVYFQTAVRFF